MSDTGKKLTGLLLDLLKAVAIGLSLAGALGLLLFALGWLFGGFAVTNGLEAAKDGLLILGAVGLFIVAGMLLIKGKKEEKIDLKNGWRKHFRVIGTKTMLAVVCVGILLIASLADSLLMLVNKG